MSGRDLTRRQLFGLFRLRPEPAAPPPRPLRHPGLPPPLRPPGALDEERLADTCRRCGECVRACPVGAILPLGEEYGPWAGTPHIVARKQPCVICEGLRCTAVCPTGALRPLAAPAEVAMGHAFRDWQRCQAFWGTPCDDCRRACPVPGAIYVDSHDHPHVDTLVCVGCGRCEQACPMEPPAIVVRPATEQG
ncbi:MAG: 4Fe-4S dicluster domain-containing protein [Myxococcales bacterium]|nr:4Fe-4S dicluster domain-containing protein [Myxococcota bacterium]MDW8280077.1 4Fe-4S dicluster domain-containing protein [Myxococcales bacterium]